MLRDLFIHLCIMITFLFFSGILFKHHPLFDSPRMKVGLGLLAGLLGSILMLFGISLEEGIHLDLRHIALMLSVTYGGWLSLYLASGVLIVSRILFFPIFSASWIGVGLILILSLFYFPIYRSRLSSVQKWILMNGCGFLANMLPLYFYIKGTYLWEIAFNFGLAVTLGGILVYYAADYITQSNLNFQEMKEQLKQDFLTGVSNSRHFHSMFQQDLNKAIQKKEPLSFIMMDIDHFKHVNDTYGHPAGDAILQQLGTLLAQSSQPNYLISRMGGEEFSALLRGTPYDQALTIADHWRAEIAEHSFLLPTGESIQITISMGVSSYPPIKQAHQLIRQADEALYQAKRQGRNQVC
ncbi:MAG TPA: GGDEF domain-containing protein [Bacillota bacterium]|nr:GGDEF domain-containing protein [Bacillota bacterium]